MKKGKISKLLINWDLLISDIVLGILVAVTFGGVIFRYVLNQPIKWLEEVQMMSIVWVVFLGSGAAFRQGGHVAVEIIVELFPARVQKAIHIFVSLLVIAVLLMLTSLSAKYVGVFLASGRCTGILRVPYYQIYGIVPLACIWMIISYLYGEFHAARKEKEEA